MDGASPWLLVPPGSRLSGRCHHHIGHLPLPRSGYCGLEAPSANQTLINSNARFRGQAAKPPGSNKSPTSSTAGQQPTSPTVSHGSQSSTNLAPKVPPLPNSPSLAHSIGMDDQGSLTDGDSILNSYHLPRLMPIWLNSNYGKHIVKGNFMTLSARPKTVEQGEWIAHQVVEHYRNLWNFVRVLHEKEEDGSTICNATTCPRMSAGVNHSFTWLNSRREPVELPAFEYMTLMQRWISGKIDDTNIFPTDPSGVSYAHNPAITTTPLSQLTNPGEPDWIGKRSGFPQNFIDVCQTIFRQMFRVYSHLYWAHFVEPFYHLNLEKSLNSCFSHFILTATALDMLKPHELEPMQPLIDLWAANGTFPPESKAYELVDHVPFFAMDAGTLLKTGNKYKRLGT
ncbi:Maintenance of ploidy protein mob2, partial [Colletotrichum shisoi]